MNEIIKKNHNAILVIRAKNALFNAGFDGLPRILPDGTIYATDKALKYCIREYLATFKNEKVFVRRERYIDNGKLVYASLEENYEKKTGKKIEKNTTDEEILENLKSFLDVRLFGIVFSVGGNISLTGPVQISYGINKYPEGTFYSNEILSAYSDKEKVQTTIGNETKTDEVYYVYDISVNKANAEGNNGTGMTEEDLEKLKDALKYSVDLITSTTKFGVESVALIWIDNEENKILNNLNDFVEIKKEEGKTIVDLKKLKEYLEKEGIDIGEDNVLYNKKVEVTFQ